MNEPTVRLALDDEIANWSQLLQTNPDGGEVFQAESMAAIKQSQGWIAEYWVYQTSFGTLYATALTKRLLGFGRLAYMMRGPGVVTTEQLAEVVEANQAWQQSFFVIKYEPPLLDGMTVPADLQSVPAIQPNVHTIWVDLSPPEDDIMATFRQRARREIRAGIKEGVTVKKVAITDDRMQQMYDLYVDTGQRAGFYVRPFEYYQRAWTTFNAAGQGALYFAYAPGETTPTAGVFAYRLGTKALYKDGGSRRSSAKHFAHLLQWEVMKDLKADGVTRYDMHGVPPSDQLENPNHPLAGLAMFKLSFTQDVTDYIGGLDQVFNVKAYARWQKYGQRLHRSYAARIKKSTLY